MTKLQSVRQTASQPNTIRPAWGDIYDGLHESRPPRGSSLRYVADMPLGIFDQEDLYPHLLTEVKGVRVAVPLGDCGEGMNEDYEVASFHYQPLPQREIHWGWWSAIRKVKVYGDLARDEWDDQGNIRVAAGGRLELRCTNPRGVEEWLSIPGSRSRRPAGKVFAGWEIFVEHNGTLRLAVRFDGLSFAHWPED